MLAYYKFTQKIMTKCIIDSSFEPYIQIKVSHMFWYETKMLYKISKKLKDRK